MSVKEVACSVFENLTENELIDFVLAFGGDKAQEIFSQDLLDAMAEVEDMEKHPEKYKSYTSVEELFADALAEDDELSMILRCPQSLRKI